MSLVRVRHRDATNQKIQDKLAIGGTLMTKYGAQEKLRGVVSSVLVGFKRYQEISTGEGSTPPIGWTDFSYRGRQPEAEKIAMAKHVFQLVSLMA